ncbi:MAG: hypothetical protein GQ468_04975 [Candidatus Scalindua sp.]|nr:hypothetical protein [Candidatus Scalindua sp.]
MKNSIKILSIVAIFISGSLIAQENTQEQSKKGNQYRQQNKSMNQSIDHQAGFVDVDGDGFNDNAPDADGDGIPNGQDADYTGQKARKGGNSKGFVDIDGDGINDNANDADGDGIPNGKDADYVRQMDGTGSGNGQSMGKGQRTGRGVGTGTGTGLGECDETGPKGKRGQSRK